MISVTIKPSPKTGNRTISIPGKPLEIETRVPVARPNLSNWAHENALFSA